MASLENIAGKTAGNPANEIADGFQTAASFETLTLFDDLYGRPDGTAMGYRREPAFQNEPMHSWWIKGQSGGVHIWARLSKLAGWQLEWIGGVECHWAQCPAGSYHNPDTPSHGDCWLLGGPCWHDGTSLYFSERIEPWLPYADGDDPHKFDALPHPIIGRVLVNWFNNKMMDDRND